MSGIRVQNLSFAHGSKQALDAVSYDVPEGAFCALLGPNGAGKSTLFALLTRLYTTQAGDIHIAGHDLRAAPLQALAAMGVVFQQQTLDLDLTVAANLRYFAALQGLSGREASQRIGAALERLDMAERAREPVRNLNGGHRRRAEIARALIHRPRVLLLDEPTVGLDAAARAAITSHVHDLARDERLTVLWATHLTDEVRADDQLIVLHRGQVLAQGVTGDIAQGAPLAERFLAMTGAAA